MERHVVKMMKVIIDINRGWDLSPGESSGKFLFLYHPHSLPASLNNNDNNSNNNNQYGAALLFT